MTKIAKSRHLLKALSWRIIATIITILLAWIFTHDVDLAMKFGIVEVVIKIAFYYFHERIWYKYSKFGVKK